jgi:type IV secretion system protein VirB4
MDKNTIVTKNREVMQVIKIEGFSFETADDEDVDMKKAVRNSLLKSMGGGGYALWYHTVRRRQPAYPEGKFKAGFAHYVNEKWKDKHHSKDTYSNDLYITVVRRQETQGVAFKLEGLFKSFVESVDKETADATLREMHKDIKEATQRLIATFRDYGARLLGTIENDQGVYSEVLEFLGTIVNCGHSQPSLIPVTDLDQYLPNSRLYFGRRAIEIRTPTRTRYAGVISIKEYSAATAAGMLDGFLLLPFEFIMTQSFQFINRQVAIEKLQLQQRRMMGSADVAISQIAEISDALDVAMSGHVAFGKHHMTVLVIEDSLKKLEDSISMALAELINIGANATRETFIMEPCYWAQLPANFDYIPRPSIISTMNMAAFGSLHNYPVGQVEKNHWGDAVTVFDTTSGTPFFFNFHLRDIGHTTIIGPTGSGKTVLMNFLCAQAQKFNCRMFFFDKDRGAEIFIRALGGNYTVIQPGDKCGFNPLKLPSTSENRSFLADWLRSLSTTFQDEFNNEDMALIAQAIEGNYKLSPENRTLRNIAPFFGLDGPGTLASRIRMWQGRGEYAGLFDNEEDELDFSKNTVFGFEMGEVLQDKVSLAPTLLYLFHRIQLALDGTPTLIVLDEAWALIDNPIFAPKIKDWMKTLRKLNAMVVFATQSVEDASKSAISDTLIQQTATQIFLPNPKATEVYRSAFMVSEREFDLLKNTDPGSRYFLVKQGTNVVVARIDLSGMPEVVSILSGRAETVALLDQIRAKFGDDPAKWIPVFVEKVKEIGR